MGHLNKGGWGTSICTGFKTYIASRFDRSVGYKLFDWLVHSSSAHQVYNRSIWYTSCRHRRRPLSELNTLQRELLLYSHATHTSSNKRPCSISPVTGPIGTPCSRKSSEPDCRAGGRDDIQRLFYICKAQTPHRRERHRVNVHTVPPKQRRPSTVADTVTCRTEHPLPQQSSMSSTPCRLSPPP